MGTIVEGVKILKVAAVVPAYNEGKRLGPVLEAIQQASLVDEIIVVNDGSTDDTAAVAS
jgi:glycosyltransferase involved in cell wall biosynthesis